MPQQILTHPWHDRLRFLTLDLTVLTMILVWLPFWRCVMDGESYRWANVYFGNTYQGAGLDGDILLLAYQLVLGLTILVLGYRGGRPPVGPLLVIWHGVLAGSAAYGAATAEEPLIFRGDTLGIELDVTFAAAAVYGLVFLLAVWWAVREALLRPVRPALRWGTANNALGALVLVLLGAGYWLLSGGEPHGPTDQIGVFVTIFNLFVVAAALRPWHGAG